jgi:zinc transporter ZupT
MEPVVNSFHDQVAAASNRWARRHRELPETATGDVVPVSLVIPVTMDCFVDGMLIGVASALSLKAGLVLALANCLEMGFLGIAYSLRISKCTGSSLLTRQLTMYCPPLLMFCAAGAGSFIAHISKAVPAVFVSFVGFGIVALLSLACGEMIIEARENQSDDGVRWYVQVWIFVGVYLVLVFGA